MGDVEAMSTNNTIEAPPEQSGATRGPGVGQRMFGRVLRALPKPLVRLAASPYIAGERLEEALEIADSLWKQRSILSTLDVLGEDVATQADIDAFETEFEHLIDALATRPYANISLKLSALGQLQSEEACYERAEKLVVRARSVNSFVRLDMEDHTTIDSTLRVYRALRERHDNCGIVLQSRLFRTQADFEKLASLQPNVRLCIGIYPEPAVVALTDKVAMKRQMLVLLEQMWENGQHVAIATHEEWVIREALEIAAQRGKPDEELEVQMLLGVPRAEIQSELIDRGIRIRLYVPYGRQWHPYSLRRLEHNPDMMKMVAGNVLRGIFRPGSRG